MRAYFGAPALLSLSILSGCFGSSSDTDPVGSVDINNKTKFSAKDYGVPASPRVTTSRKVRKGGGRRQVGKPYQVKGKWYTPKEEPDYDRTGQASWYGPNFHGRLTANGEVYDQYALSGAHPTFPLPSYARVTNLANGKSVVIRINDRGPYHAGRVVDMSAKAAELLDYKSKGIARVRVQYVGQAPLHGLDEKYLASTYQESGTTRLAYSGSSTPKKLPVRSAIGLDRSRLDPISTNSVSSRQEKGKSTFWQWLTSLRD